MTRARPLPRMAFAVVACAAVLLAGAGAALAARAEVPADVRAADALAAAPASRERDRALLAWARRAPLADLLYVLRRPAAELATVEAALVTAALAQAPPSRAALRARLEARLALADPKRAPRALGPRLAAAPVLAPRASGFRLGLLLPDSGAYVGYARAVRMGVEAALADANSVSLRPVEIRAWGTGDEEPARAAAAADSAGREAGVAIGPLLSVPAFAAAAALRVLGIPLVSPTATDESIGESGPAVFQIGPSGARRAAALAAEVLAPGRKVAMLVDGDLADGPFARGFAEAARAAGAVIVWRGTYAAGHPDHRPQARQIQARAPDVLFWDGEPRDGAAVLRALAREQVRVQVVGGEGLSPAHQHADARPLLEGARWVAEDWAVPEGVQGRLDSLAATLGEERAGSLYVRGYYAGRFVASAVLRGAHDPAEIAADLAARRDTLPVAARRGFLDGAAEGARLPVWVVERGR
uniref:Amino acid ABC transporter substrate-binding protein n=1 Tax=Eiseniibacteriota bacterium TaxID=2212470 RepID=A0A832MMT0_UNCEI